jgi:hypothetical protein
MKALVTWMKENGVKKNLDLAFIADTLDPSFKDYEAPYLLCKDKEHRTKEMITRKNVTKKVARKNFAKGVKMLKGNPLVTDDELLTLNIALDKGGRKIPLPPPTTSPVATFDTSHPGRVTTILKDEGAKLEAMPHDAETIEMRRAILDHEPKSMDELTEHVTLYTTKDVTDYPFEDQGKVSYSMYRYVSPTGKPGPWSPLCKVRIP